MQEFKLGTVAVDGEQRSVLSIGESLFDVESLARTCGQPSGSPPEQALRSVLGLLEHWDDAFPYLSELADRASALTTTERGAQVQLAGAGLLPPILYPRKVLCAASNYAEHAQEMRRTTTVDKTVARPYFFHKPPTTAVVGPGEPIRLPRGSNKVDWEGELAVVMGRRAKEVSVDDAMDYVAGYTIMNDVSARDRMSREDWPNWRIDWFAHKCFDTFAPMGPFFVPKAFVPDPHDLGIRLWVSGELKQNSNTARMIFNIPEMIEYLSSLLTLEPGDVISTGTPAGVGAGRGTFLKSGDTVVIEIDRIGRLENPVV